MLTAGLVAKYFVSLPQADKGNDLTNLKLQKLLYYAQGHWLNLYDSPLFPEPIEAWLYGPVIRAVYDSYKDESEDRPIRVHPILQGQEKLLPSLELAVHESVFLDDIYRYYGQYSAWKLVDMTHQDLPWKSTFQPEKPYLKPEISLDILKQFFKSGVFGFRPSQNEKTRPEVLKAFGESLKDYDLLYTLLA